MECDPRNHSDPRERDNNGMYGSRWGEDARGRDRLDLGPDARDHDPRDPFVEAVDLPCGLERELVQDSRERLYELNGDESRMLATIGAFRVVSERDLDAFRGARESLQHLREEELIRSVPIGHDEKAVVLTRPAERTVTARRILAGFWRRGGDGH